MMEHGDHECRYPRAPARDATADGVLSMTGAQASAGC
jgi:hypothetical protein